MSSNKKKTRLQRFYKVGNFVHFIEDGSKHYGRIAFVDDKGIYLETPDDPINTHLYENKFVRDNFCPISEFHIEILTAYSKELNIGRKLMVDPIDFSVKMIKENKFDPKNLEQVKSSFVPEFLNEIQWIHWKRRIKKKFNLPQDESKGYSPDIQRKSHNQIFKPQDFFIRVHTFNCSRKNHTLQPIQAEVLMRSFDGKGLSSFIIPAGYCKECNYYYILSSVYERKSLFIKNALCDFVDEGNLSSYIKGKDVFSGNLAKESIMKKCGYTVSSGVGLDDREREALLKQIIQYKILSQKEVESFLNWLIHFHMSNPLQGEALYKWQNDLEIITENGNGRIVQINRIIK